MITSKNFAHIELVENGIQVLFYVEHSGDETIIHQVVAADEADVDMKLTIPGDKVDELWPDAVRFADAAAKLVASVREMGLTIG